MPGRTGITQPKKTTNGVLGTKTVPRSQFDIAGQLNDLFNAYIMYFGAQAAHYLPLIVIGIILIVVMILAVKDMIDG